MSGSNQVISQICCRGNSKSSHVHSFLQAPIGLLLSVVNITRMYLISCFVRSKLQRLGFCIPIFMPLLPSGVQIHAGHSSIYDADTEIREECLHQGVNLCTSVLQQYLLFYYVSSLHQKWMLVVCQQWLNLPANILLNLVAM